MNEKKLKIVKNMMNVSIVLFAVYVIIGLIICLQPQIFLESMLGYGKMLLKNEVLDFYRIGEFIITGIIFGLLWFFSRNKVSAVSDKPTALGVLNVIMAVLTCVVTPFIVTPLSYSYAKIVILPQSKMEYAFFVGISEVVHYVEPLLFIPAAIFLCAYVIYWVEVSCNKKI